MLRCHAGGCSFVGRGVLHRGHCAEDGRHVLGLRVGGGWLEGSGHDLAAGQADLVGSGGRGRREAAVSAFRARLGWAPVMREGVRSGVRGGEQFAWVAFGGRGGWAWGLGGVCGGRVRVSWRVGRSVRRGAPRRGCMWVAGCGEW